MDHSQYIFFSGNGGVGKSTMACATAVQYAEQGLRTLIITTDPASNLANVFETAIGHKIAALHIPNLWAMEIDPDRSTEEYRERILCPMRAVMPVDFMVAEKEGKGETYDVVILDTAPTGHTLRLPSLPFDYSDQVSLMVTTTERSATAKSETQQRFNRIIAQTKNLERSEVAFVIYPESTPVVEAYRAMLDLKEIKVRCHPLMVERAAQALFSTETIAYAEVQKA